MDLFGCWHQGLAVTNRRIDDPKHTRRPDQPPSGKEFDRTAMRELTDLQRATLDWIRQYVRSHGIAPTRAEIAAGTGVKHQSVVDQRLLALERKGWIELKPGERPIHPAPRRGPAAHRGGASGRRGADRRRGADPGAADPASVAEAFRRQPDFFLRVEGDSMNRIGLRHRDR